MKTQDYLIIAAALVGGVYLYKQATGKSIGTGVGASVGEAVGSGAGSAVTGFVEGAIDAGRGLGEYLGFGGNPAATNNAVPFTYGTFPNGDTWVIDNATGIQTPSDAEWLRMHPTQAAQTIPAAQVQSTNPNYFALTTPSSTQYFAGTSFAYHAPAARTVQTQNVSPLQLQRAGTTLRAGGNLAPSVQVTSANARQFGNLLMGR